MCLDCFLTFFNFTNDSVIEIMSSKGAELFFPVVCLILGDMMELLTAARVRSANFARLLAACYICEVAGCQLGQHIHSPLRSLDESNQVITAALTAYQSGVGIGVANVPRAPICATALCNKYVTQVSVCVNSSRECLYCEFVARVPICATA